jgi:energy-coupling factor transporter transmembrane protein EcfT
MGLLQVPWATARGGLLNLAPESRLIAWVGAMTACFASDPATWPGLLATALTVAVMELLAVTPARVLLRPVLLAAVVLGPVFVLTPWTSPVAPEGVVPILSQVVAPWRVFVRGVSVLVLTTQVISTLSRSDFRDALSRLPLPSLVGAIVQQVLFQVESQGAEVRRIGLALQARGATSSVRNRLRVGFGLPRIWLGRLAFRAQRSAMAMEARGFTGEPMAFVRQEWRAADIVCLLGAMAWSAGAAWLRWRGAA